MDSFVSMESASEPFVQEPDTLFGDPERIRLLQNLASLFKSPVTSQLWGFLWMSDRGVETNDEY
jgi:hypothetical protein